MISIRFLADRRRILEPVFAIRAALFASAVQGDGVATERRQGLGVDAGSDHRGREGVPALVQRSAIEAGYHVILAV